MAIIFYDGFEKYGPPSNSSLFGFVGSQGNLVGGGASNLATNLQSQGFLQEWSSTVGENGNGGNGLIIGRQGGTSVGFAMTHVNNGNPTLTRNLPASYNRFIIGYATQSASGQSGVAFIDSATGTQCSIWTDNLNRITFNRAGVNQGNVLYTSTQYLNLYTWHYIEIDVTIGTSTGSYTVWLDGVQLTTASTQNTQLQTSNTINQIQYVTTSSMSIDDLYMLDGTGPSPFNAHLGDVSIQTVFPSADNSVAFTKSAQSFGWVEQGTVATNAAGANQLVLVPFTPSANATVNSVGLLPGATSVTAKFKGVIYSDSSGAPSTLLSSGTEVVGTTSGTNMTLPLVTPQAIVAGTQYWIGYITDTSVVILESDTGLYALKGQRAANTYASGAPASAPAMTTAQVTWSIWANCTGTSVNWAAINQAPGQISASVPVSYLSSANLNDQDLFSHTALTTTATTISAVKLAVLANKNGSFARSLDLRINSNTNAGNSISSGSGNTQGLAVTLSYLLSYFTTDPDTLTTWTAAGVNNSKIGYKVTL